MSQQEREAVVDAFAALMKQKLTENAHKGDREGWLRDNVSALLDRLREETDELEEAMDRAFERANGGLLNEDDARSVACEAADVGNFAMMLADCFTGLKVDT